VEDRAPAVTCAALDLYARDVAADPFPTYAHLRTEAPVHPMHDGELWALSRYEDVVRAAADPTRFSSRDTNGREPRSLSVLVGTDGAEHARLRRHASRALAGRRLGALTPRVDAIVVARVGAFADAGGGDAVADLAEPVASATFADLLGLDPEGLAARRGARGLRPDPRAAWRAFFLSAIASRRRVPGADVISALLEASADGDRLSEHELVGMLGLLLAAGADTTRDLLANLLAELAACPGEWARLLARPGLVHSAVEESLRHGSPIQAMFRSASGDVEIAGARIPAGARVMLLFGSADRDERRWADADRFDVERYAGGLSHGRAHVAFGNGPHACPGAQLARRIARVALGELVRRRVRIAPAGEPQRGRNPCFRSLRSLPLQLRQE
jgi:cytochrome P450